MELYNKPFIAFKQQSIQPSESPVSLWSIIDEGIPNRTWTEVVPFSLNCCNTYDNPCQVSIFTRNTITFNTDAPILFLHTINSHESLELSGLALGEIFVKVTYVGSDELTNFVTFHLYGIAQYSDAMIVDY